MISLAGILPGSRATLRQGSGQAFGSAKVAKTNNALPGHIAEDGRRPLEGCPTHGACPEMTRRAQTGAASIEASTLKASQQASGIRKFDSRGQMKIKKMGFCLFLIKAIIGYERKGNTKMYQSLCLKMYDMIRFGVR